MKIKYLLGISLLISNIGFADETTEPIEKLTAKEIAEHAAFWIEKLPELSQEEFSLLANYLYLETMSLYNQCIIQRTLIAIHTASPLMNKQLMYNEPEAKNIANKAIRDLTDLQKELLPSRAFLIKSVQQCMNTIEQSNYTTLKKLIINYQQYGRAVLAQFIRQDKSTIQVNIVQTRKHIENHIKIMSEYLKTIDALLRNENPYVKEGIDKDVSDMDLAMTLADSALGCLSEATLTCAMTKSMNADLLSICALFNKIFYNTLYQALEDNDMLPVHLMFNEDGIIDESERDEELPLLGDKLALNKRHIK